MFEAYVVDLWQDTQGKEITESSQKGEGVLSIEFRKTLDFSITNAPWYVLHSLDERVAAIHPVHMSRCLIGPFESKYRTQLGKIQQLPIIQELLRSDTNAGFLRASIQYSYAPNHELKNGVRRQVVYRQAWSDEFIVVPSHNAARVNESMKGTNIRICEIG